MTASSTTYLLVHGAFRGGWAWSRVQPLLEAAGHRVVAPTLAVDASSLAVWVEDLVAALDDADAREVVAVGHSLGGVAVAALAARVGERLRALVFLDAPEPLPGERGVDLSPGGAPKPLPPRGTILPPTALRPGGDLGDATAAWMNARLTPTPLAPSLDPVPPATAAVPRHYAFCTGTPPGYPAATTRLRLDAAGTGYTEICAGHDAPITAPRLVADLLLSVVVPA